MMRRGLIVATVLLAAAVLAAVGCERLTGREAEPAPAADKAAPGAPAAAAPDAVAPAAAQPAGQRIERLPNGVRVIVRERHLGGVAAFRVYIAAGSLNEGEFIGAGVSHFLEHIVSGGATPTRSEEQIQNELQAIGAQTNAHTSKQFVCYHGQTSGEHIGKLVEVIGDYVVNALITPEEFNREFNVIQREIERSAANPDRALWQLADETVFGDHSAGRPILGYLDVFRQLKHEDLVRFYREVVVPDRTVVVAVGDFSADAVFEKIRATFGAWPRRTQPPTVLPARQRQTSPRLAEAEMDVQGVRSIIEFPTVSLTHPDLYPLDILAFILGEGRASRLVSDLRDRRGLAQSVSVSSYTPAGFDGGRFLVTLQADPAKAEAARAAAMEHLARAAREKPTDEELARAKRQKIAEHVYGLQQCEDIAGDVGLNALLLNDPDFSQHYVSQIQRVTADDVRRVAAAYLDPGVVTVTTVRPKREAAPAVAPAAPAAERPPVIVRRLANGVRLLLCPVPGQPTVSIQMVMKGGLSVESEKDAGTSSFMARMLMKGTAKHKADEIARLIDTMGAEMGASSGYNTIYLSARCLAGDFEKTFDLAAECLLAPTFPAEEVERLRALTLTQLAQMADTPQGEASLYFNRVFFTDSPYQFPVPGTPEVVRNLKREDLAAWHKRFVAGNNLVVAVFGGIDLVKAANRVAQAVEGLPANPALAFPADVAPRRVAAREVYIKPSAKGAAIVYVAYPGMDIFNVRDRFALELLDTVVSGYHMPSGWLHEELRGKGLVYEVHAFPMMGLRPGYFAAMAVCQPEKAAEVVGIIEKAMERAAKEEFKPEQLVPARATIITAKELGRETVEGWAFEAAVDEALGLGHAFAREEIERVRQVRPEDVARVARQYLKTPVVVVVTSDTKAAEAIRK
ncbi:MAG: insulinase family protein [Planctomycetes bacterium]|nr:insulinase family protein [Planctomycetota bacterium]